MITPKLLINKYFHFIAEAGFLILFPGFFFYHLLVAANFMPSFAAGLFGPATVVLCILFLIFFIQIVSTVMNSKKIVPIWFLILVSFVSSWCLVHYLYGVGIERSEEAFRQVITILVSWIALFFVGMFLPFGRNRFKFSLFVCFVLMFLITTYYFDQKNLMFNVRELYKTGDIVATYQGFSRSALCVAVALLVYLKAYLNRLILIAASIILLFLLGARSELFAFIALSLAMMSARSIKSFANLSLTLLLLIVVSFGADELANRLHSSRQMQVMNLDKASSWVGRQELQRIAVKQISENPMLGQYAGHFKAGGIGSYAHNVLSAWVSFGFIGFCLYFGLVIYCFYVSLLSIKNPLRFSSTWEMAFSMNFLSLFLLLIAKPIFWPIPALGWGLVVNAMLKEKEAARNQLGVLSKTNTTNIPQGV